MTSAVFVAVCVACVGTAAAATTPPAPVWPEQFHATLLQNRGGSLAKVELYYDWVNQRNYNLISPQLNATGDLWDLEYGNGTTLYYYPNQARCSAIDMGVGILRPDWLNGSVYAGEAVRDNIPCHVFEQADLGNGSYFATYYSSQATGQPVGWTFFDKAEFEVLSYTPGVPSVERHVPMECPVRSR
eukprot:TRINITY_DN20700_c0_g1_i1.p1 TRINITY_DN20700_c0_g1~~TRINITY_DN20700_c0_g1_i1.p1  ORF type:complete len:202 (+),score=39.96 TRINITY_DN20700_c0_g1_i1:51-608(+)